MFRRAESSVDGLLVFLDASWVLCSVIKDWGANKTHRGSWGANCLSLRIQDLFIPKIIWANKIFMRLLTQGSLPALREVSGFACCSTACHFEDTSTKLHKSKAEQSIGWFVSLERTAKGEEMYPCNGKRTLLMTSYWVENCSSLKCIVIPELLIGILLTSYLVAIWKQGTFKLKQLPKDLH